MLFRLITNGNLNISSSKNGPTNITKTTGKILSFCKFLIVSKKENLYFSTIIKSATNIKKEKQPLTIIKNPKATNNSFKDSLKELCSFSNPLGLAKTLVFNSFQTI